MAMELITFGEYVRRKGVNKHSVWPFAKSGLHGAHEAAQDDLASATMLVGRVLHELVEWRAGHEGLPPQFVDCPDVPGGKRTAKLTKAEKDHPGKTIIADGWLDRAERMHAAIAAHPIGSKVLRKLSSRRAIPEASIFWDHPELGCRCKARLDILEQGRGIIDIKTTGDISRIDKAIGDYGYHAQQAWYCDGAMRLGLIPSVCFLFLFVESVPPYDVAAVDLPEEDVQQGMAEMEVAVRRYLAFQAGERMPGISDDVHHASLPRWLSTGQRPTTPIGGRYDDE
jgi:hypothetical protein